MNTLHYRLRIVVALIVFNFCFFAQGFAQSFTPPDPEDLIIYQIFIDRFANGDPSNDDGNPRASFDPSGSRGFHGGDIEGIRQRLPYIRQLGANAIWITPFVENVSQYHGYAAYDWYSVDPNFGTIEDLRGLVSDANDLGIAVYFDLVAGHMGDLIDSAAPGYPGYLPPPGEYDLRWRTGLQFPPPFDSLEHFHAHGHIGSFVRPEEQIGELFGLDDLKTETPYVQQEMLDVWSFWTRETGVNGFRVDTVKHVDLGFWESFLPALRSEAADAGNPGLFIFGEIFGADDAFMREYIGNLDSDPFKFDSALDFQFFNASNGVFARATAPPSDMIDRLDARKTMLPGHHLQMPNFIDNHDVRRFLNLAEDNPGSGEAERRRRLELALAFMMTAPGPPVIYYGTEQGFDGGNDPFNREDMFDGQFEFGPSQGDNFDSSSPLYQYISRLASLRSALAPLRRGSLDPATVTREGPGALSYARRHEGEAVYIALNTSTFDQSADPVTIPEFAGIEVANALNSSETLAVPASGLFPQRDLEGQDLEIWVPRADVPPPSPGVLDFIPADSDINIPTILDEIAIVFFTPMNESVTEAVVSVSPPVDSTPSWNGDSQRLTLTLNENLQPRTEYTVSVNSSAESADGQPLGFSTSATWMTGRVRDPLPPMPDFFPAFGPAQFAVSIDGARDEWPSIDGFAENSGNISDSDSFVWRDALMDDDGPGSYTYPTDDVFTQDDVDLAEFHVAYDETNLYFLLNPVGIKAFASFFTPYLGIAIDTAPGGSAAPLGYGQGGGALGITELEVRADAAPEFEINFTGPRGATLLDRQTGAVETPESVHSEATGVVEIAVPRASLGLEEPFNNQRLHLVVYTAFETFGGVREVSADNGRWDPGGGIVELSDPDVFDLAGASREDQAADLSGFDSTFPSTVKYSILPITLNETESPASTLWTIR